MSAVQSSTEVLEDLKLFQRVTAEYAYARLYDANDATPRFLVADEVGLGKTLVARGVIAQVVEHLRSIGDRRVDIVYICSNAAIARQNLRKLNIADDDAITQADRLTLLANEIDRLEQRELNLIAVTPGTSLEFGQSSGNFRERALLYAVLREVWGHDVVRGSGEERVFYLGIEDDRKARRRLKAKADESEPSAGVIRAFKQQLLHLNDLRRENNRPTVKVEFNQLAKAFAYQDGYTNRDRRQRNRFIVELRRALATVGIEALQPDLVILDEFQRFRVLLDPNNPSWGAQLAHELFDYEEPKTHRLTRTLLLSATPYRPYTTADDGQGDDHFEDFIHTARFLLRSEESAGALRSDLKELRRGLLSLDRDQGATALTACERVAERLRPVMARTERLASTPDRSGMLTAVQPSITLEKSDVEGYVATATAARLLGQHDVVEFWKSGPYLLNFMEGYALKHAFDERTAEGLVPEGLHDLVKKGRGLLSWEDVQAYATVDPANARLRALVDDTVGRDLWQLLWLPPALPYYRAGSAFETDAARGFSKRLVFSAWNLVPKVISAILSYDAERALFSAAQEADAQPYDAYSKRSSRLLDFKMESRRPESMANLLVVVPFPALARMTDPVQILHEKNSSGPMTRAALEIEIRKRVTAALADKIKRAPKTGVVDQRWYWAAPLLLDLQENEAATRTWWEREAWSSVWTGDEDDAEGGNFGAHRDVAEDFVLEGPSEPLGRVPDDLVDVLVACAMGSPALAALRALSRLASGSVSWDPDLLNASARMAWGFRSLFNGAEATAIVRTVSGTDIYWRGVFEYGALGNLQAMLDEYLHVLRDWRGFLGKKKRKRMLQDLAETACNALTLRAVSYATDIPRAKRTGIAVDRHTMRGRFAIRFGDKSIEGEQRAQRAQQASEAFNSPFWPFVLSTTSIGQEGLDFHLYSHSVVHWNLPTNPVDFEQREGRVHRYKGHAIRKNVAAAMGDRAFAERVSDPWAAMFASAAKATGDTDGELSPYWVFCPEGSPARIERHLPLLPLSRDLSKLDRLLKGVAAYRLSFGQPRQEELVHYLADRIPPDELAELVQRLRIDLSPPSLTA
ncbi:MAG: helicase [Actinobacteria bacterium]|nr:helicase [Actinomycetota bacterium]